MDYQQTDNQHDNVRLDWHKFQELNRALLVACLFDDAQVYRNLLDHLWQEFDRKELAGEQVVSHSRLGMFERLWDLQANQHPAFSPRCLT